ncbi:MAG TPA: S8 family serine peptidase [Gaiellaceae bacterium]|nr:S8 family serine peptidase [Gaiellaceae bacterium]
MRQRAPLLRLLLVGMLAAATLVCARAADAKQVGSLPSSTATADNLSGLQWDMTQIKAPQAHEITGGSPLVRVALIDSGIDPGHPEFAGRIDTANSASCLTGEPVTDPTGELWKDRVGHGTHVAGIIAAGDNGFGTVGVAPNVELLVVKVTDPGLPITPAAAACAFEYAAGQHVDVANASFAVDKGPTGGADPLDFFCPDNSDDNAAIALVGQAVADAEASGTTVVASTGNNGIDMAHPAAGDGCIRMPVQLPGVIGVASEGRNGNRATSTPPGPSNFGLGAVDFVAPGGDPAQGGVPGGLILSTFPSYIPIPPTAMPNVVDGSATSTFRYNAGTSMAAAHVTGVAALIVSRFGELNSPANGKLPPSWVANRLRKTAVFKPCPADARCETADGYNGFFGYGEVDALAAVTR